jgi:2-oxoisovalerate dehydrogenase E1 component alpha subunit
MATSVTERRYSAQLTPNDLQQIFYYMLLSRRLDERSWALHRQGKIAFHVSAIGHEAAQVAMAFALTRGVDYAYPYYRDLALCLTLGITPKDFMFSLFGKAGERSSNARQMPSHWSAKDLNIVSQSSSVATQVPQAAGTAFAIKYRQRVGLVSPDDATQPRLAFTALGEGSTSQGEWHEGMNWAGVHQLPFICMVENNNYAISVPYDQQAKVPLWERAEAYGVRGVEVDGLDPLQVYDVAREAVERAYSGDGPTLIEAKVIRMVPHSSDDDHNTYRSKEELEAEKKLDPVPRFQQYLLDAGILTQDTLDDYERRIKDTINTAQREAEAAPYPPADTLYSKVYAPLDALDSGPNNAKNGA